MDGLSIAASLVEVRRAAEGAVVRTVHEPQPGVFLLGVFGAGQHTILLSPRNADVHCTELSFRNPERPSSFVMQLRKHLRGGRIRSIHQTGWERALSLETIRDDAGTRHEGRLVAELTGLRGNLLLLDAEDAVLGSLRNDPRNPVGHPYVPLAPQEKRDPRTITVEVLADLLAADTSARALARGLDGVGRRTAEDLVLLAAVLPTDLPEAFRVRDALDAVLASIEQPRPHFDASTGAATFYPPPTPAAPTVSFGEALDRSTRSGAAESPTDEDRSMRDQLLRAMARDTRTARALRQWLDAAETAGELRRRADFLMLHAPDLGRGTTAVSGEDPAGGERLSFALAPRMNGMENARAFYKKARKLDRGRPTVAARLARVEANLTQWREALAAVESGRDIDPALADALAPRSRGKQAAAPSSPRQFDVDGFMILVGRSAKQNDELMRRARPDDLWLHARDVAGSHVVVCRRGRAEIPSNVVDAAARYAARYSKADRRGKVAVVCTEARHVKKPRNGAPGLAIVTNESTLTVDLRETP